MLFKGYFLFNSQGDVLEEVEVVALLFPFTFNLFPGFTEPGKAFIIAGKPSDSNAMLIWGDVYLVLVVSQLSNTLREGTISFTAS